MSKLVVLDTSVTALHVTCQGAWTHATVHELFSISAWKRPPKQVNVDFSAVRTMDTAGAMAWLHVKETLEKNGANVHAHGMNTTLTQLVALCFKFKQPAEKPRASVYRFGDGLVYLGKQSMAFWTAWLAFVSFAGGTLEALLKSLVAPKKIRFRATLHHLEQSGLRALPIIIISTVLIGVVIAYQGAAQLEKFGANIFIVEMVGISATRELAPLIVAIVIAGRSASAFTAQIGVMKITEEIDAMKTMGFGPWEFLVLPRVIALMVALPLLVIVGDAVAIFGGMLVARGELGVGFEEFLHRFQETVALKHVVIGLIKAPVFGLIIGLIGCYRGFQISSSTESVGKYTTISVVNAIFWVIAFDALFSVLLTELGI